MTAVRHLRIAPTAAEQLAGEINDICRQIDRRLHNRPGAAERGIYAWYWPPDPLLSTEVLTALHRDAVAYLHNLITDP